MTFILLNNKIVMPATLQDHVVCLSHEGDQGVLQTKQHLRSKNFWPEMKSMVESFIQKCHSCQDVSPTTPAISIKTTSLLTDSWIMPDCDLYGTFSSGEHLLVCVDYTVDFQTMKLFTSSGLLKKCKLFCHFAVPKMLVTDNDPYFVSAEIKILLKELI